MIVTDIKRMHVAARFSDTAVFNGVVYLAGQVPTDPSQDAAGQTREVLETVDRLLNEVGSDKSRILMAQIFLPDLADYAAPNGVTLCADDPREAVRWLALHANLREFRA